jgi:hypothetical protein
MQPIIPLVKDWNIASTGVTQDKIRWAINGFSPYKSACADGIFPALLQLEIDQIIELFATIFTASLALGYLPEWQKVQVWFIPKPN